MKIYISLVLVALSTIGICQDYNFKPVWNKGDQKQISITTVEREYEDDQLIVDTTYFNDASLKVIKDEKETYVLEILMENQALRSVATFYEKLGEDLVKYKNLKLVYSIDKQTAKAELLNWEEAQKFMTESFGEIKKVIEDKVPDMAFFTSMIIKPMEEIFQSKENIESYMESNIGYILIPFGRDFKVGETISETETQKNPFNPSREISSTTKYTLESVNSQSKTCKIKEEVVLDLSEFIATMKEMVKQMGASFGGSEEVTEEKLKELEDFKVDVENERIISFDYSSSWVTEVVSNGSVTIPDPRSGVVSRKVVVVTTVVK